MSDSGPKRRRVTVSPGWHQARSAPSTGRSSGAGQPPKRSESHHRNGSGSGSALFSQPIDREWEYEDVAPAAVIEDLMDAYHAIVYPLLHFFHWPTFMHDIKQQRYRADRAFYTLTMAMCAIATARLRDGAIMPESPLSPSVAAAASTRAPPSELFYRASIRAFPSHLAEAPDFDYKRAKAVLSVTAVQYGIVRDIQTHIGDYVTLCAQDSFNIEARWPPNLNELEIQERRRLDVYLATTWGGIVRHRESQSTVLYPAEVDDEEITPDGIVPRRPDSPSGDRPGGPDARVSFMRGWNFTTDMYRILEHLLEQMRQRRLDVQEDRSAPVTALYSARAWPSAQDVLECMHNLYDKLPNAFKHINVMTGDHEQDRYGFQGVNIIVTMQTVKMVLAGLEDATSVEKRCSIAGELVDAFSTIPTAYIHAISSPTLHHLAGVGHLLGSVIQSPLSPWAYLQVRNVLLAMAALLSNLESTLSFVPGIAEKLRAHVNRIDQHMTSAAMERNRLALVYSQPPPPSAWADVAPGDAAPFSARHAAAGAATTAAGGRLLGSAGPVGGSTEQPLQERTASGIAPALLALQASQPALPTSSSRNRRAAPHMAPSAGATGVVAPFAYATADSRAGGLHASRFDKTGGASGHATALPGRSGSGVALDTSASTASIRGDPWAVPPLMTDSRAPQPSYEVSSLRSGLDTLANDPLFSSGVAGPRPPANGHAAAASAGGVGPYGTFPPAPAKTDAALPDPFELPDGLDATQFGGLNGLDAITLPNDLFVDWPFDMGQGEAFDFLGDWQGFDGPAAPDTTGEGLV